jgi:hypothetical protein
MSSRGLAATSSSSKTSANSTKSRSFLIGDDATGISYDDPMGKASELDPTKRAGTVT